MEDRAQERTKRCQIASGGQEGSGSLWAEPSSGGPGCRARRCRALGEMSRKLLRCRRRNVDLRRWLPTVFDLDFPDATPCGQWQARSRHPSPSASATPFPVGQRPGPLASHVKRTVVHTCTHMQLEPADGCRTSELLCLLACLSACVPVCAGKELWVRPSTAPNSQSEASLINHLTRASTLGEPMGLPSS